MNKKEGIKHVFLFFYDARYKFRECRMKYAQIIKANVMKIDFKLEDTGKEYWVTPVSKTANEICKHYKGVYMRQFLMQYHQLDDFIEFYNKWWRTCLAIEEEVER